MESTYCKQNNQLQTKSPLKSKDNPTTYKVGPSHVLIKVSKLNICTNLRLKFRTTHQLPGPYDKEQI